MEKHQEPPNEVLAPRVKAKSAKLMQAQYLKAQGRFDEAMPLFREVAAEEERLGTDFGQAGNYLRASINLISAASCWAEVREYEKALKVSDEVLNIKEITPALRKEVREMQRKWRAALRRSDTAFSITISLYPKSLGHGVSFIITALVAFIIIIILHNRLKPESILLNDARSGIRPLDWIKGAIQTIQTDLRIEYAQWASILLMLAILVFLPFVAVFWSKRNLGAK